MGNAVLETPTQAPLLLLEFEVEVLEVVNHVRLHHLIVLDEGVDPEEIFGPRDVTDLLHGVFEVDNKQLNEVLEFGSFYPTICARNSKRCTSSSTQ